MPNVNRLWREYRQAAGLSFEQLAELVGRSPQTLRNAESTKFPKPLAPEVIGRGALAFGKVLGREVDGRQFLTEDAA